MALNLDTAIRISANVQGGNQIQAFSRDIRNLETAAKVSSGDLGRMNIAINRMAREAGNTTAGLRQHISALQSLRDRVDINSNAYRRLGTEIDGLRGKLRGLDGDARRAGDSLNRGGVSAALRGGGGAALGAFATGGGLQGAAGALSGSLLASGSAAALAGAAGVTGVAVVGAQAFTNARALEDQARRLRVMTDSAGSLQAALATLVREQGYLNNSTEATAAAYDVLQAGFASNAEILDIVRASALGAAGGFTDLLTVSDALTSILNGYSRSASDAAKIVDQIKAATDDGKISFEAYAQSIGKVVPSAAAAKIPLEEVNAAISALTAQGVPVETTFSGINQVIKTILKPTKEAQELSAALGLEFNAQALAAKGLGGFLEEVGRKTGKSSDALSILFSDIDGYKAVVALLNDDLKRFNQFTDNQANAIGRASQAAKVGVDPIKQLANAWKDLTAELGKAFTPGFLQGVKGFTDLISGAANQIARLNIQNTAFRQASQDVYGNPERADWLSNILNPQFREAYQRRLREAESALTPAPARPALPAASGNSAQEAAAANASAVAKAMGDDSAKKAADEAEKRRKDQLDYENDLFDIRLNFEKRLADFREQSLDRAKQMERDIGDQRLQLERDQADIRRRTLDLYEDDALEQRRFQLQSAGLDTSAIDLQQRLNDISRKATEDAIRNQESATDRRLALERQIEDYKMNVAKGIRDITVNAGEQYADRVREGVQVGSQMSGGAGSSAGTARQRALLDTIAYAEGTSGARGYQTMFTGRTFSSFASHPRMIQRGGRYASDAAGRYQFLSTTWDGVARSLGLRDFSPANQDIGALELIRRRGVNSDAPLNLRSLAALAPEWASLPTLSGRSYYGQPVKGATDLLRYYNQRLALYGQGVPSAPTLPPPQRTLQAAMQPATPLQPMNAASLQVPGVDGLAKAAADYQEAIDGTRAAGDVNAQTQMVVAYRKELGGITRELDSQLLSVQQQSIIYDRTLQLQRSGLSPELAQQTAEREQTAKIETASLILLRDQLKAKIEEQGLNDRTRQDLTQILQTTESTLAAQQGKLDLMQQEAQQLEEVKQRYEQYRALIDGTANAISGGLGSAFDLLIDGTENWGNSLRGIASGVLRDIAKQLVQIYAVQPATKGLQGLLGSLLGGGGSAGAAAAAGAGASVFTAPLLNGVPAITGAFANGGIMTDRGPLPLRAYANGGIATGPQLALFGEGRMNEAYVPLPDGRRIPVAMQGGGGSNVVNVTVNAEGSAVQGDSSRSEQLGQVVARAIQEEMIRQRRPGGLLAS
jgi:TP901 family phage tail tape measure protein